MTYTAKAAVCSEIRTKHSTQSDHHVEFGLLNLLVRKETDRLWKVNYKVTHNISSSYIAMGCAKWNIFRTFHT